MNIKYLWAVLDEDGKVQSWNAGTKFYTRKLHAEAQYNKLSKWKPNSCRVVKYRLVEEAE